MPEMKLPGPDHPITIAANARVVAVTYQGHQIASSEAALTLKEATYPAVQYIPRGDVAMSFLRRTDKVTYCPYKGEAHYFSLFMDGRFAENAVWTYEDPYPAMETIRDHLAFYPNQVEIEELGLAHHASDAAILHTDAGDGASQQEHWKANVSEPGEVD